MPRLHPNTSVFGVVSAQISEIDKQIFIFASMDVDITFKQYLKDKLIDSEKFQTQKSILYSELEIVFNQMHPDSFTAQKLFLINPIRRKFLLEIKVEEEIKKQKNQKNKSKAERRQPAPNTGALNLKTPRPTSEN